jgi:hypothetical protein
MTRTLPISTRQLLAVAFNQNVVVAPVTRHQRRDLLRDCAIQILRNHDPFSCRAYTYHSTPRLFFDCLRHLKVSCALHILSKSTNLMIAAPQTHWRRGMTNDDSAAEKERGAGSSLILGVGHTRLQPSPRQKYRSVGESEYRDFAAAGIGGIPTASRAGVASGNRGPRERRGRVGRPWHRTAARPDSNFRLDRRPPRQGSRVDLPREMPQAGGFKARTERRAGELLAAMPKKKNQHDAGGRRRTCGRNFSRSSGGPG